MSPVETVVYSDGTTATGVAPLPRRSPAQQGHDHLCSLRRQMRFLEQVKSGHADSRREIAALRWAIETLELARAASTPQPADAELRRLHAQRDALLEVLKLARSIIGHPDDAHTQMIDAAIKAVEGEKT